MRVPMVDPAEEAAVLAFHAGYERAAFGREPYKPTTPVGPLTRTRWQAPTLSVAAVKTELEFDLTEAIMAGAI